MTGAGLPGCAELSELSDFARCNLRSQRDAEPFFARFRPRLGSRFQPPEATAVCGLAALLHGQRRLLRWYTEAINGHEISAKLPPDRVVQCNGSCRYFVCQNDPQHRAEAGGVWESQGQYSIFICETVGCNGILLPDVTFLADPMPQGFQERSRRDFAECDLLLILGTALRDNPFALLPGLVRDGVPRVLVHRDRVAAYEEEIRVIGGVEYAMPPPNHEALLRYDHPSNTRDAYIEDDPEAWAGKLKISLQGDAAPPA
jgi:NAD-dependent SIR2 family protein deacetylase